MASLTPGLTIKKKSSKYILITVFLILGILYVAKFGGPSLLRAYIKAGVGTCKDMPILCMAPDLQIADPKINKEYIKTLLPYNFPKMLINIPREFMVVKERVTKIYYKKYPFKHGGNAVYLLQEDPDFFIGLFPQVTKHGVNNNYEFIRYTMFAKLNDIKNITDTFFVIMKSVFTPDIGDMRNLKMTQFTIGDKKGFINYNLTKSGNYFDCNLTDTKGNFFKVYMRDKDTKLDLDRVLTIISTIK